MSSRILIIDYGSQYTQLIARRVRESRVYSEIHPPTRSVAWIREWKPTGIILSGGPNSVYGENVPTADRETLAIAPVLGVCYGMNLIAFLNGGQVVSARRREYGRAEVRVCGDGGPLMRGFDPGEPFIAWMSHGDQVKTLPPGFMTIASSESSPIAAFRHESQPWFGVQFHPEVAHTPRGGEILANFLFGVCEAEPSWTPSTFIGDEIAKIRGFVGDRHVICGLSGGVDSSVAATLVHRAVGERLTCVFVDTGLLRLHEREQVERTFRAHLGINLVTVDASARFLDALKDVEDPEEKRRLIGHTFIDVFEDATRGAGGGEAEFLVQGTLYPDVIESASPSGGPSVTIKTHHNVGGLKPGMKFKLIEPLRELFKDEVRNVGRELGLPEEVIGRHPFPGPGLGIRVLGPVTREALDVLRQADAIYLEEIRDAALYERIWQAFAVLLPIRSVGVMGDYRTYENVIALRAVTSTDGMTADWFEFPHDALARISNRIINEVRGVNRVVYDVSSKPPATIEWE